MEQVQHDLQPIRYPCVVGLIERSSWKVSKILIDVLQMMLQIHRENTFIIMCRAISNSELPLFLIPCLTPCVSTAQLPHLSSGAMGVMFVISWAQWDTGVITQKPLIIPKLFRKNKRHKNPGLCCSRLPVQGQEYISFFLILSQIFSFPLTALLLLPSSLAPSLNLVNSFSSYQDGIRQKRLHLETERKSFSQMYLPALHWATVQWRERERQREAVSVKFLTV